MDYFIIYHITYIVNFGIYVIDYKIFKHLSKSSEKSLNNIKKS
jgi:NDP-sugar pyrophosphorylase family protein